MTYTTTNYLPNQSTNYHYPILYFEYTSILRYNEAIEISLMLSEYIYPEKVCSRFKPEAVCPIV